MTYVEALKRAREAAQRAAGIAGTQDAKAFQKALEDQVLGDPELEAAFVIAGYAVAQSETNTRH
ncbi:hypothetical protein PHO31112_00772 [Pandoraea horticolens]|uniref:Uncharacterized protein n=1 Tax=Pandoraea horticolens TaxID=2508298 RepID=A0A5E4SG81_9BURK|nr:hypothetical protein [Pandoraea horticolens]VVD74667.1 hypothetical protein PHO31112_00772 [Pandoraea horticolens]